MNLADVPAMASDETFHVVIESPRGSALKLKYEPKWRTMVVWRPLALGLVFPFDWGFVPSTKMPDGDPLDAFLVWDASSIPGLVVECGPIGVLQVSQNRTNHDSSARVRNDRILAVPIDSPRQKPLRSFADLGDRVLKEYEQFAIAATTLQGKDVEIVGWATARMLWGLIREPMQVERGRP